jgi:hypothetical protein
MDLKDLTLELAKPLEGTIFQLDTPDGQTISMKLEEVLPYETQQRRRQRGAPELKRPPFALYFVTSAPDALPQGMYTLRSETITFESLFIVPVGRDETAVEYEAIFN